MLRNFIIRRLLYVTLSAFAAKRKQLLKFTPYRQSFIYSAHFCGLLFWNNTDNSKFEKTSRKKDNFIVDVTRKCSPSVVYIEIKDLKRIVPETGQPMTASNGSGFIIDSDGWIMTNAHVVINRANALVLVTTNDGITYRAEIKDVDMKADLALLKIPASRLQALKMGDSSDVSVGEWVVALGSPLSLSHTTTAGIISSVNRDASELGITNKPMKYIQTDAAITFGHSGGPLVNLDGEVIGINNLRITAGIAFAIPIDYAKEFLSKSSFMNPGEEKDSIGQNLGVTLLSMNSTMLSKLISEKSISVIPAGVSHGVLVWKVLECSIGQKSGLTVGDIITHLNGTKVYETSDVYNILSKTKDRITVTVTRNGTARDFIIKLKK